MREHTYKYSVIIPHKNVPELLNECLESIPQRDDLQVVIIDDNSDKPIGDFEHFPGLDTKHIAVYSNKRGKGAGGARNTGLQIATGEWVIFADADDTFNRDALNELLDTDLSEYDVVAWKFNIVKNGKIDVCGWEFPKVHKNDRLFKLNEPWRKMVRRSFIEENNISFQESIVSDDLFYSLQIAHYAKRILFYEGIIYNWRIRSGSLSYSYQGKKLVAALNVAIKCNRYLKSLGKCEFYDQSPYYLSLLCKESKLEYWYYVLKIAILVGIQDAKKDNLEASKLLYTSPNPLIQLLDHIRITIGYYKNRL